MNFIGVYSRLSLLVLVISAYRVGSLIEMFSGGLELAILTNFLVVLSFWMHERALSALKMTNYTVEDMNMIKQEASKFFLIKSIFYGSLFPMNTKEVCVWVLWFSFLLFYKVCARVVFSRVKSSRTPPEFSGDFLLHLFATTLLLALEGILTIFASFFYFSSQGLTLPVLMVPEVCSTWACRLFA